MTTSVSYTVDQPIRALSVRQPWGFAITDLGKRIENRGWRVAPSYRGPLLIHASSGCTRLEYEGGYDWMASRWLLPTKGVRPIPPLKELPLGAYVAVAELVGAGNAREEAWPADELRWAIEGQIHLRLANVTKLSTPIPAKGMLGLYVPDREHVHEAVRQVKQIVLAKP